MKADSEFMARTRRAFINNRQPILAVLQRILPSSGTVLEVGSGFGNHALYFASRLPSLTWQASDPDPDNRANMAECMDAAPANLPPPLDLDILAARWPVDAASAVVAVNVIHIAPWEASAGLMKGASRVLQTGGVLYLYGAYKQDGRFTTPSNAEFDESLRQRNPLWGVRDLEDVTALAKENSLSLSETVEMPNNNLSVVFHKE